MEFLLQCLSYSKPQPQVSYLLLKLGWLEILLRFSLKIKLVKGAHKKNCFAVIV